MWIKKGQGSLEYLFIVALVIIIVAIGVMYLKGAAKEVPYYNEITLDPGLFNNITADYGDIKVEAYLINNGDGTYKVEYKVWAIKVPIRKAQLALICMNKPPNVAGYKVITHEGLLTPVNYWANYWTPIPEEYFPCEIRFYIWKE
ncbi:class III signal peptide-containing protein [Thermococcus barophilus]|uniref:Uncharacterized protein n=1 Tax=Thermococcus barophilus (strain DSM 11836 / MP) TaxID=391623 RepID=F0LIM6_THEBM|nr:class III signal peptide-containing protein [Thermococcus barophilus]ADT83300.1 hypothetical protein TERMP_00323 [Thermococcus barophilus MP]